MIPNHRRILDIMTATKSSTRRARIPRNDEKAPDTLIDERFPPLTISLTSFVKDGSDQEFRQLIYALTRLQNQMARHIKLFAGYLGVTEAQAVMMRIIAETPDATVGYLAQRLNVTSQFVTIEIGDLVKKNIVEKRPNPADRRSMFLSLTRRGKSLLHELAPIMRKGNDIHFRSLTEERARALQDMINALVTDGMSALREVYTPLLHGQLAPSARTS
jgi:DNA-binding MarR family transcriptional regulator